MKGSRATSGNKHNGSISERRNSLKCTQQVSKLKWTKQLGANIALHTPLNTPQNIILGYHPVCNDVQKGELKKFLCRNSQMRQEKSFRNHKVGI